MSTRESAGAQGDSPERERFSRGDGPCRRSVALVLAFVGCTAFAFALVTPPAGQDIEGPPDTRLVPADRSVSEAAVPTSDEVFYFAYGANMSPAVFVDRRHFHPVTAEAARSYGHELVFAAPGMNFIEPAFAALRRADGQVAHGVLYRLPRSEVRRLHGLENGYDTFYIDVVGERSGAVRAYTYDVPKLRLGLKPSRRYVAALRGGARQHGLPAEYVVTLERQPVRHIPVLSWIAEHVTPVVEAALLDEP